MNVIPVKVTLVVVKGMKTGNKDSFTVIPISLEGGGGCTSTIDMVDKLNAWIDSLERRKSQWNLREEKDLIKMY